jgi:hypothetical protein
MEQKFFNVKNPTETVTIIAEQSNFYQLSDGIMIKKELFSDKYQPVLPGFENEINENVQPFAQPFTQQQNNEKIDPNSFFKTNAIKLDSSEINNIKNIDTSKVVEQNERTTIVKDTTQSIKSLQNISPQPQPIINENKDTELENINRLFDDEKMVYGENEATLRRNKRLQRLLPPEQQQQQHIDNQQIKIPEQKSRPIQDPLQMMISTFKKVHEITFNFEFKDKIANPEFIKLMMQNMDGDIISYYKQMVMNNILTNVKTIEDIVEQTLKEEIGISDEKEKIEIKKKTKLVTGKINKNGKQLYKFINDKGKIVELLKSTGEKKGFKPFEK